MRHPLSLFTIALMTATTVVMGAIILTQIPGAQAQSLATPEQRALQVYEALPNFPKENQYKHRRGKKVVEDNTLVSRLIRYHVYNQSRSAKYRLDWKITFADYLGINEFISKEKYPSSAFLRPNPFESDIAKIQSLSASERNQLIQVIVDVYDPSPKVGQPRLNLPSPAKNSALQESVTAPSLPSDKATDLLAPVQPKEKNNTSPNPSGPARFLLIDETP